MFNLQSRKWSKLSYNGDSPSARDGHFSALIFNRYMLIYGGIDENDNSLSDIYLFDVIYHIWYNIIFLLSRTLLEVEGKTPILRDSQSCSLLNNICYIFGGQVSI